MLSLEQAHEIISSSDNDVLSLYELVSSNQINVVVFEALMFYIVNEYAGL